MVQPYTAATTQNNNKCPHGLPIGTCPICNGSMGGSSKSTDKNKPRKAGEMSYNECLAAWHKIQAKKEAKIQDRIDQLANAKEIRQNNLILKGLAMTANAIEKLNQALNNLIDKTSSMSKIISTPVKFVANNIIKPILNLTSNIVNGLQTMMNNILQTTKQITEKMMQFASSVFGEIKNFIEGFKSFKLKKAIKIFLTFFNEGSEEENEEEDKIEKRELVLKRVKEIFEGVLNIKNHEKELKEKEKND